ncbi:MAG: hypothetical protein AAF911_05775 [Planctomycetota bacterium]
MLPSQTQRLLMLLAVVVGIPAWWWAAGFLPPADGLSGWALSDSRVGLGRAAGLVLAAALPAVIAAGLIAATGNPLSGVCCVALAGVIAHHGSSIVGVARRAAELGNEAGSAAAVYQRLAVELGVGIVMLTLLLAGLEAVRGIARDHIPRRLQSRHLGGTVHLWKINGQSLIAGVITAAVGAVLTAVLVQSDNPQQVTGGLVLAFTLASLIGHAVMPNDRPWATLVAPALVGIVGYVWTARQLGTTDTPDALLSALYTDALPGLALGLPLHYLTAGVLGCAIGIGIGQVIEKAKLGEV